LNDFSLKCWVIIEGSCDSETSEAGGARRDVQVGRTSAGNPDQDFWVPQAVRHSQQNRPGKQEYSIDYDHLVYMFICSFVCLLVCLLSNAKFDE
jgi:hypothetical protein